MVLRYFSRPGFTDQQKAAIVSLYNQGMTLKAIAERLGVSYARVQRAAKTLGCKTKPAKWSRREIRKLIELKKTPATRKEIAAALDRSGHDVAEMWRLIRERFAARGLTPPNASKPGPGRGLRTPRKRAKLLTRKTARMGD